MKPLSRVPAEEILHFSDGGRCRALDLRRVGFPPQVDRRAHFHLVLEVPLPPHEDGKERRASQGGELKGALRDGEVPVPEIHRDRSGSAASPIDLDGNDSTSAKPREQIQRVARVSASVHHVHASSFAHPVVKLPCTEVPLGGHHDRDFHTVVPRKPPGRDVPGARVSRHDDHTTTLGQGCSQVLVPPHEGEGILGLGALGRQRLGQTVRVTDERAKDVPLLADCGSWPE